MAADYDQDLYTWSREQAALLRERKFDQIDLVHIVEEIEDMGKSEQRTLESYLEALLIHLLKLVYQPSFRRRSWRLTITEQRKRLLKHLRENPGLKRVLFFTLIRKSPALLGRRLAPVNPLFGEAN
jgi:hypothetical protein